MSAKDTLDAGELDTLIVIERKSEERDPIYNRKKESWVPIEYKLGSPTEPASIFASMVDVVPTDLQMDEDVKYSMVLGSTKSRVRIRYRAGITSAMRLYKKAAPGVYYQIVAGPAIIGRNVGLEFIVERFTA